MAVDQAASGEAAQRRQREVETDRLGEHGAVALAVLRDQVHATADGLGRGHLAQVLAAEPYPARRAPAIAADQVHQELGAARAHQAADSQDLAGANLEADAVEDRARMSRGGDAEAPDLEHHLPRRRPLTREEIADVAADHQPDDLLAAGGGDVQGLDALTVAQDGHPVGEGQDLLQAVGNVDAGDATSLEPAQDAHQQLGLRLGERRRRLVEEQDAGVLGQGLDDLHELLLADPEVGDGVRRIEVDVVVLEQALGLSIGSMPVDQPAPGRLGAQEEVLGHRHLGHQGQLLVDHRDARGLSVVDSRKARRLTFDAHLALVAAVGPDPAQHLDQG